MGLLDDAIREHLDLKRRRGADPAEVERAEREALGPVRRGPERAEMPDTEFAYQDDLAAHDLEDEPAWGDVEADEPAAPAPRGASVSAPSPPFEDEFDEPARAPAQHLGDETAEYNVEEALEHEHHPEPEHRPEPEHHVDGERPADGTGPEGEALLEETPEFLQDTPDHDRLWFEQRPPRDFKFDS